MTGSGALASALLNAVADLGFGGVAMAVLGGIGLTLLIILAARDADNFKENWVAFVCMLLFAVMFIVLGILGQAGVLGGTPGVMEGILLGTWGGVFILGGVLNIVHARKGAEWASMSSGIFVLVLGVLCHVAVILIIAL